jgi:hypothetical protein
MSMEAEVIAIGPFSLKVVVTSADETNIRMVAKT